MTEETHIPATPETVMGKNRKATKKDFAITAVILLLIAWQLDLASLAKSFIYDTILHTPPKPVPQNFNIIMPQGQGIIDPDSLDAIIGFENTGQDMATINNITITNPDTGKCQQKIKTPLTVDAGKKFTVTAANCGKKGSMTGLRARITVDMYGSTSLRSKILSDPYMMGPIPRSSITDEQQNQLRKNMEEQINRLQSSNQQVPFRSSGAIIVIYSAPAQAPEENDQPPT